MKKIHNNLSAYCNSTGLKEHYTSAPLRGSIQASENEIVTGTFWPIMGHVREQVFLLAALLALLSNMWLCYWLTGSCNKWWVLHSKTGLWWLDKAELQATPSAGLSRAKTDQVIPLQISLWPFCLVENLWCKLDVKERVTTNKIKCKVEQKQGLEGAAELLSYESQATASLIPDVAYPSCKSVEGYSTS